MSETEITIRAAAFYRIIGNAQSVVSNEGNTGEFLKQILDESNPWESPVLDALGNMAMQMKLEGAQAKFPVDNVAVLGEMIIYVIRYYQTHPELASKIATMCGMNAIGSILGDGYGCPLMTATQNARLLETATLNNEFHKLSKDIDTSCDVKVSVEFFVPESNLFHHESQFIRVVITV